MRKILHCDMDAFYASIEQRDNPDLRGRPVAVGGGGTRGVVAAASYEARAFGVRSAMPGRTAERLCPDLVFVRSRMDVYRDTGLAIRAVFARYTPMIEPLSLDEAYLDVTEHAAATGMTGTEIARDIKAAILREFALTVSAGVSNCKFAAKIASGWQKPDGLTVIPPERVRDFIATLPIGRFHGVGPATARKLTGIGVQTGADLRTFDEAELVRRFGKFGTRLHQLAQGIDERPVEPHRERKSVGAEQTFASDIAEPSEMASALSEIIESLRSRLARAGNPPWLTLTLKIRTNDFRTSTRSRTLPAPCDNEQRLFTEAALALLYTPQLPALPVRLLGVTVSNFTSGATESPQLALAL